MIDWIVCKLTATDNVKFITSDNDYSEYKNYKAFIKYISTLEINNYGSFVKEINKYRYLFIDLNTKEWIIYDKKDDLPVFSVQELSKYNDKVEEEKDIDKSENTKFKIFIEKKKIDIKEKFKNKNKIDFRNYFRKGE